MSDSKIPLRTNNEARSLEIRKAVKVKEEQLVKDTIILQKVNKLS